MATFGVMTTAQKQYRIFQYATLCLFGGMALGLWLLWDNPMAPKLAGGIAIFGAMQIGLIEALIRFGDDDLGGDV